MTYKTIYPSFNQHKSCLFRVWAPMADSVRLVLFPGHRTEKMEKQDFGYWEKSLDRIEPGTRYKYMIDNGGSYPDPASLSQPEGVHGPSELIRLDDFNWTDEDWENIPLSEMIIYELHTGTFSPGGNFEGISARLDYLKDLGINAIELMPVAQFSGSRNWGYDGVYPFAVHDTYGGATGLMKLVNDCHRKGLAVILDVVYNHFGPEGNYLSEFGPYFSENYSTPWGKPVNFDGPHSDPVRLFIIQNAIMWCRDFHIDGLRLDAVHAIYDFSATHILQELADNLKNLSQETGQAHYMIAESNLNDVRYISPAKKGGLGLDAQWSDDFHHAVHTLATDEKSGYYADFGQASQLSKAIKDVFVFDGQYSEFRKKIYGNSAEHNPGGQFVIFNQNHDQIGNRKFGERLISLTDFESAKLFAGTMCLTPNIPMLFMGEEYGERNPFLYFVSHLDQELNQQVRKGRENEFDSFYNDEKSAPDPASPETFENSKLSWQYQDNDEQLAMLEYYKELIHLRKNHPVMRITDKENLNVQEENRVFLLERWQGDKRIFACLNFTADDQLLTVPGEITEQLKMIIDSSSTRWKGPGGSSPEILTAHDQFAVPGKTIVVYSNHSI